MSDQQQQEKKQSLRLEVLEKMSSLVTAGLGLVAALAWNDAIKKLFEVLFGKQSTLLAMFLYAILITVIIVFITIKVGQAINKIKEEIKEDKDKK